MRHYAVTVATLDDRVVQAALTGVLNPSSRRTSWVSLTGSGRAAARTTRWMRWRPGSCKKKVNWVLDADIRDFFTSLDQGWLEKVPRAPDRGPSGSCA